MQQQPETNKLSDQHIVDRRKFLSLSAASMVGAGAAPLIGDVNSAFASTNVTTNDLQSSDSNANRNWPFASDGFLYNYVAGTVVGLEANAVSVLIHSPHHSVITVVVPADTEIYCRGSLEASLINLNLSDRVEIGTSFISQGVRAARWIVINGMAAWSTVSGVSTSSLILSPLDNYGATNGIVALTISPTTRVIRSDQVQMVGDASALTMGDNVYWTGLADSPGSKPDTVWAIIVHQLL